MVEELAVLCGPANLHDPRCVQGDLVVPQPRVAGVEGGPDALEGGGVAPGSQPVRSDLQVLAGVVQVEDDVGAGHVGPQVRRLPHLRKQDCKKIVIKKLVDL